MKQVTVRLFAVFREVTGQEEMVHETSARTAADLYAELCHAHEGLEHEPNALVAINEEMSRWDQEIFDGDTVLLFPPVAGG